MADRYPDFATLADNEREGIDYRVCHRDRRTTVAVLAPHGGTIERGTSLIARSIAQAHYSFYCFEGLRARARDLHITSCRFDEPRAVDLLKTAETVVAIHGRADGDDPRQIWMGGRDAMFRDAIAANLGAARFQTTKAPPGLAGEDRTNICNRGTSGAGVQLEIPRSLRDRVLKNPDELAALAEAVRQAIANR
jgi:phage replication-related protein YjqB (UPF0714/DUF867 family)